MPRAHITDISRLPLFDSISAADCTLLFDCLGCRIRRFQRDEQVHLERELEGNIGTILEGKIHLYKEDVWGNRTLVSYMEEGELFGETASLANHGPGRQRVTYLSASPSLILFLPADRILHPCNKSCPFHHQLSQNLFHLLGEKNRMLMDRIEVSSKGSVREKILTYLSMEAQRQGSIHFRVPLRRTEMAEYLCVNRSAMSRELSSLKKEGLIDYDRDLFTVHIPGEKLEKLLYRVYDV